VTVRVRDQAKNPWVDNEIQKMEGFVGVGRVQGQSVEEKGQRETYLRDRRELWKVREAATTEEVLSCQ